MSRLLIVVSRVRPYTALQWNQAVADKAVRRTGASRSGQETNRPNCEVRRRPLQ